MSATAVQILLRCPRRSSWRRHIPSVPAPDDIRRHAATVCIRRFLGQQAAVPWADEDRRHVACTS
jgi:hypothetical protein